MNARVLVVDDHRVVREGLKAGLQDEDLHVVGDVATGAAAISAATRLRPDVVILDARLPDIPGPLVCASILERVPTAAVAFLSAYVDAELVAAAIDAGASAYLLKDAEELELADTVRRLARGERFLDARAGAVLLARRRGDEPRLTRSEISILRLAAEGCTNREIGAQLYLSPHTVKEYLSNAMRKLDVDSRVAAAVEADRRGLLGLPAPTQA
jgi:DNA-binding NarL/FixJ family response regulator